MNSTALIVPKRNFGISNMSQKNLTMKLKQLLIQALLRNGFKLLTLNTEIL